MSCPDCERDKTFYHVPTVCSSLRETCLKFVGQWVTKSEGQELSGLPKEILQDLTTYLNAATLKKLDAFFESQGVDTSEAWRTLSIHTYKNQLNPYAPRGIRRLMCSPDHIDPKTYYCDTYVANIINNNIGAVCPEEFKNCCQGTLKSYLTDMSSMTVFTVGFLSLASCSDLFTVVKTRVVNLCLLYCRDKHFSSLVEVFKPTDISDWQCLKCVRFSGKSVAYDINYVDLVKALKCTKITSTNNLAKDTFDNDLSSLHSENSDITRSERDLPSLESSSFIQKGSDLPSGNENFDSCAVPCSEDWKHSKHLSDQDHEESSWDDLDDELLDQRDSLAVPETSFDDIDLYGEALACCAGKEKFSEHVYLSKVLAEVERMNNGRDKIVDSGPPGIEGIGISDTVPDTNENANFLLHWSSLKCLSLDFYDRRIYTESMWRMVLVKVGCKHLTVLCLHKLPCVTSLLVVFFEHYRVDRRSYMQPLECMTLSQGFCGLEGDFIDLQQHYNYDIAAVKMLVLEDMDGLYTSNLEHFLRCNMSLTHLNLKYPVMGEQVATRLVDYGISSKRDLRTLILHDVMCPGELQKGLSNFPFLTHLQLHCCSHTRELVADKEFQRSLAEHQHLTYLSIKTCNLGQIGVNLLLIICEAKVPVKSLQLSECKLPGDQLVTALTSLCLDLPERQQLFYSLCITYNQLSSLHMQRIRSLLARHVTYLKIDCSYSQYRDGNEFVAQM